MRTHSQNKKFCVRRLPGAKSNGQQQITTKKREWVQCRRAQRDEGRAPMQPQQVGAAVKSQNMAAPSSKRWLWRQCAVCCCLAITACTQTWAADSSDLVLPGSSLVVSCFKTFFFCFSTFVPCWLRWWGGGLRGAPAGGSARLKFWKDDAGAKSDSIFCNEILLACSDRCYCCGCRCLCCQTHAVSRSPCQTASRLVGQELASVFH